MAGIFQPKGKNKWHAFYRINGKVRRPSTGFDVIPKDGTKRALNEKRARQAADLLERREKGEISGSAAAKAFRALADMVDDKPALTVSEYLTSYEPSGQKSNRDGARRAIQLFLNYLTEVRQEETPLAEVKLTQIEAFLGKMLADKTVCVSTGTVGIYRAHLVKAFNEAIKAELITSNPASKASMKAVIMKYAPELHGVDKTEREIFTAEEMRVILFDLPQPWRDLAAVGACTGQRIGDCSRLTWAQIDFNNETISFKTTKTKTDVWQPMHPELVNRLQAIRRINQDSEYVFPALAALHQRGSRVSSLFGDQLRARNILAVNTTPKEGRRHNTPTKCFHSLRHSLVSIARSAGVPADVCRDYVGHKSEAVERIYYTADMTAKKTVVDALTAFLARPAEGTGKN